MNKIFRVVWNQATQSWVAVSELTKAHKKQSSSNSLKAVVGTAAVLLSINTAQAAVAIGETTANNTFTQSSAQATGNNAVAIGQNSKATKDDTIALGTNSKSTNTYTVALGRNTEAAGQRSMAFGNEAKATANDTIAFGSSSEAKKNNDIIIGKEAKSRDEGGGHSVAVGYNATAGSTKTGAATDVTSTGKNTAAGGVAIGVSSYTGLNRNNAAINSSVAIGAGAGAGFRAINADGIPTGNGTDPDDNATVLAKAFGNTSTEAGNKDAANRFDYKGVDINEGTAVGRNTRAIGDQAVALGAQSIAGQGAIAIGGNDITQFANARYFMSNRDNFGVADVSDHDQSGTLASKNISQKYQELVGAALNTAYQATYAQNGSTVIGMQAHSTTPLGVAIGTNALVRKGAYGATAIGSGSAIQANAEAAVAIGMGSWVNGKFGVAAGTASRAEQSAVAAGYKANADKSAVAIGDSSNATTSSVAVGQLAQATKEADIAVGQGAKASGNQGAIAMGLGTNAQGDSSIMIGGSNISSAANQKTEFEKAEPGKITKKTVTEKINGQNVDREYTFAATKNTSGTIAQAYKELTGLEMDVSTLDFADTKNKNGHASTSLGVHALAKGNLATAIGASARADAIGSLALGTGAHATKQNAVAIGTGSTTDLVGTRQLSVNYDSDGKIVSDNSPDIAYTFKWAGGTNTSEGDVVSFGSSGAERQLKNVAAGRVAEDSTDAINGSQLNAVARKVASGWQVAGNDKAKVAGIGSDDQINFTNGEGTKVTVTVQQEVKKTVNENGKEVEKIITPKGANVKFDVKAADKSLTVGNDGVKVNPGDKSLKTTDAGLVVNTDGKTITTGDDGLKVITGEIESVKTGDTAGTVKVKDGDAGKIATVDSVVSAVNSAAFTLKASATTDGTRNTGSTVTTAGESIKAGSTVEMIAGKNLDVKHDTSGKITFATVDNPSFNTVQIGGDEGPKLAKADDGSLKVSDKDDTKPVKITNVNAGDVSATSTDAINGSQFHGVAKNTIKLAGKNGDAAATETTDQTLDQKDGIKFTIKSSDGTLLDVTASGDTITLTPKTGKITTGTDGVPTANITGGKLVTADEVVKALTEMGWKATADQEGTGTVEGKAEELIKAGNKVTFKAGNNLAVKQAGQDFIYSLNPVLSGLTSAEFKNQAGDKTVINSDGVTITPVTTGKQPVSLTNNGLNNGGNAITDVAGNLDGAKTGTNAPTTSATKPTLGTAANEVNSNNAATVGDVLNAGWNLQGNNAAKDFVTAYDTVNFIDGEGTSVSVENTDNKTSKIKYSVNLGDV